MRLYACRCARGVAHAPRHAVFRHAYATDDFYFDADYYFATPLMMLRHVMLRCCHDDFAADMHSIRLFRCHVCLIFTLLEIEMLPPPFPARYR